MKGFSSPIIPIFLIIGFTVLFFSMKALETRHRYNRLRIGYPAYWGSLIPPLQHTLYGAALIENQFEPLVRRGRNGLIELLAAKSWSISEDFRTFTFVIDTKRRFSDGSYLKADDFKRAWTNGLVLETKAANHSLRDVLYKLDGFSDFEKTKQLTGVRVIAEDVLEVRFQSPFRIGLEQLSGKRLAVYKVSNGKYIGTGPFVMNEQNKIIYLTPNEYSQEKGNFREIQVLAIDSDEVQSAFKRDQIDIFAFADTPGITICNNEVTNVVCATGEESSHRILDVNGLPGRLFSNKHHRLALQSLIAKDVLNKKTSYELPPHIFKSDLQVYLPFQHGRISDETLNLIVAEGDQHINEMVTATKTTPIYYITAVPTKWPMTLLQANGVKFTSNSGQVDLKSRFTMLYKTFEPDLIMGGFAVVNTDPDGLYHVLGKNGAIFSPMTYRKTIGNLLEEGRAITDITKLHSHYKEVSEAILREVPFVHLGYTYGAFAYREDRVSISDTIRTRNDYRFNIFSPK